MTNGPKHHCNLKDSTFIIFVNYCQGSVNWQKSLLLIYKILRLFAKTLTADDKHYLLNRDNLTQPIEMQLSQKQKTFSELFLHF